MNTNERIEKGLEPEVSIVMTATDMHATLTFERKVWTLTIVDMGFNDECIKERPTQETITLTLNEIEAACVTALFVGYGEAEDANEIVTGYMYDVAEKVFNGVPKNLRIIP